MERAYLPPNLLRIKFGRSLALILDKNKTKFRGVSKNGKKYQAEIRFNKTHLYIGSFETPELAAKAYDQKAKEIIGEKAILNY